jgi:benzoyl-CoA reductase/2-hydroxyglutaryl-CoA dehydratase subunit BcrC/BadD/HgdB
MNMAIKVHPLKVQQEVVGLAIAEYYADIRRAHENREPTVWSTGLMPAEVFMAGGFLPLCSENLVVQCAAKKLVPEVCAPAEIRGCPRTLCTYTRVDLGSMWAEEKTKSPVGYLPPPSFVVSPSIGCSVYNMWYENISRYFKIPFKVIETPFIHDFATKDDRSIAYKYVKQQVLELISFMEDYTKKPFDWDKLAESMTYTRDMSRTFFESIELMKTKPAPATFGDLAIALFGMVCLRGSAKGPEVYKLIKKELEDRVAQKFSPLPEEKYRLCWSGVYNWERLGSLYQKFGSYGANIVSGAYTTALTVPWLDLDLSDPLEAWVEAYVNNLLNAGLHEKVNFEIERCLKGYSIDGIISLTNLTCKTSFIGQFDQVKDCAKEMGIPYIIIEGDIGDPRLYDVGRQDAAIDNFMEMLEKRR